MAEEVISTVRTAQAFGTQPVLAELYDTHINKSRGVDMKAAIWHGGGLAIFFFVIYNAYALGKSSAKFGCLISGFHICSIAFNFGTTLINQGHGILLYSIVLVCVLIRTYYV